MKFFCRDCAAVGWEAMDGRSSRRITEAIDAGAWDGAERVE